MARKKKGEKLPVIPSCSFHRGGRALTNSCTNCAKPLSLHKTLALEVYDAESGTPAIKGILQCPTSGDR